MDEMDLLTQDEAAQRLRFPSGDALRRFAKSGGIGYVPRGRKYLFRPEDIADYIAANHVPAANYMGRARRARSA